MSDGVNTFSASASSQNAAAQEIVTTGEHRFWSVSRATFVEAKHLRPGELFQTPTGQALLVEKSPRIYAGVLYNLETLEHVYCVGANGVLVHNSCYDSIYDLPVKSTSAAGAARPPRHHIFPQAKRQWFKNRGISIDDFTVELDQGVHSAIHTYAGTRGGWNDEIMGRLFEREADIGRMLDSDEIIGIGQDLINDTGLSGLPLIPYQD